MYQARMQPNISGKVLLFGVRMILVKLSSALKDCAKRALYLTSMSTRGFQTVPISALKCLTELAGKKKNLSSSCVREGA